MSDKTKASATQPDPSPEALLPFADVFSRPDFQFGTWAGGETRNGVTQMGYFVFSADARAFLDAASQGHWVRAIKWSGDEERQRYDQLCDDEEAMKDASAADLSLVLTSLIRGDRFCEGLLASAFDDGILHRVLDRVKVLSRIG